jgi:hypothetical protein
MEDKDAVRAEPGDGTEGPVPGFRYKGTDLLVALCDFGFARHLPGRQPSSALLGSAAAAGEKHGAMSSYVVRRWGCTASKPRGLWRQNTVEGASFPCRSLAGTARPRSCSRFVGTMYRLAPRWTSGPTAAPSRSWPPARPSFRAPPRRCAGPFETGLPHPPCSAVSGSPRSLRSLRPVTVASCFARLLRRTRCGACCAAAGRCLRSSIP